MCAIYIYMCIICIYVCVSLWLYIERERDRDRERKNWFPVASNNLPKTWRLKNFFSHTVQEIRGLKQNGSFCWGCRRETIVLSFSFVKICVHSLVHSPSSHHSNLLLPPSHLLLLTLILLPAFYKDTCGYTGPTQIIQDNLPISKASI